MKTRILLIGIAFQFLPLFLVAQTDAGGASNKTEKSEEAKSPDTKLERQRAKRQWKKNRKQEMGAAKAKKEYSKKYNTKMTRKRMKRSQKKALQNNAHKRDFFLVRWWNKIFH